MLYKIGKVLLVVIALLVIGYLVVINMPKADIKSKEAITEIAAEDLYRSFSEDEAKAQSRFLGKVIAVTGIIDEIYEDEIGAPVVILKDKKGEAIVLITLDQTEKEKVSTYSANDDIKVKALCSGMLMEVTLSKGVIVE